MSFNLPEKPTWQIQDSTKIQTYLDCPRRYFYEYVLGWQLIGTNIHLIYGSALHAGLEHIKRHNHELVDPIRRKAVAAEAFTLFTEVYKKEMETNTDDAAFHKTKNPMTAMNAFLDYVEHYKKEPVNVLYTEVYGQVLINEEGDTLHYKIDVIEDFDVVNNLRQIRAMDHKTSSQFSRQWIDSWALSFQMQTYIHVLYSAFQPERVWGVVVNGIKPQDGKPTEFFRVPVQKTMDMMNVYLWHANEYVDNIKRDFNRLHECSPADNILQAFPQNPQSCTKYFGCPFRDFCSLWPNPLRRAEEPPLGFTERHWNPAEEAGKARYVVTTDNEFHEKEDKPNAS